MRPPNLLLRLATATLLFTLLPTPYSRSAELTSKSLPTSPVLAQTTQERKAEADRLLQQGTQQVDTRQFEAAFQSLQQALQIYRELKDRLGEEHTLGNLGLAYFYLGNYGKAIEYHEQSLAIAREIKNRSGEGIVLGNLGDAYYSLGNYGKAIEYYEQRLAIAREIHDRFEEGQALGNLGDAYYSLGNYGKAIEYHEQRLAIAREIYDRQGESATLDTLGVAYQSLDNYAKAIEYEQQALVIAREIHDRPGEGIALGNLGAAYIDLGNYAKAIEYEQQALVIDQEIHNRQGEGVALGNLGTAYQKLGNYAKAIEYEQQALVIDQEIHDRKGESQDLGSLGNAYSTLGNNAKAIEYEEQALVIAREIQDRQNEGGTLGNLGSAYAYLGNNAKAIEYYQQALAIAQEIKNHQDEGLELGHLGVAYHNLGNDAKAIEYHQQALAIARAIQDRQSEGMALGNLGSAYASLGNYTKAIEYHQQDLVIAREIQDRAGEGAALSGLGTAYDSLGNYAKAIEYNQQALAISRKIKGQLSEGIDLNNLGDSLFKSGNLTAAAKALMDGITIWELLRQTGAGNDANKVSIFENQARTYRTLQKVLVAQKQSNAALEIAERGRARALVNLLAQRVAGSKSQEAEKPPNLAQTQQIARTQNSTLVEYSITYNDFKLEGKIQPKESALYIWVIQPNGQITFRSVDLKPLWRQQKITLAELIENSRKGIGVNDHRDRATLTAVLTPEYRQQLHEQQSRDLKQLHHLLIEPIADLLPTDPTAHVIFMPQESLFLVPFAALMDKSDHYLIQQHTISIAPAIQVLGLTHQQQKVVRSQESRVRSVLVAGNPIMPKVTVPGADAPLYLPDLPGAKQEAIAVAKTLHTTALTGKQAAKHTIVQQMQTARIIHLATHGLLDDFKGLGVPGAIALAPDGTGQRNDGLLTSDDILGMKLNAELVVLSACNTGRGKLTGDGVIGLSRSLIAAGVPSIMVSLWSVPDAPTAALMTDFYTTLQHTPDKAQALRQAMLNTMKDHPEPRDWAAFTLIGEAQ